MLHPNLTNEGDEAVAPPQGLAQVLRPYQVQGYRWLLNNARHGLGCLLADDMGLGKTIQAIALILQLREESWEGLLKPMLIVAPTGLLHNWQREITKWAKGTLEVSTFHGKRRALPEPKRQKQGENGPQVLLTSYGVLRTDAELLSDEATAQRFGGVVLDEAQSIKNCASQVASKVSVRVALSGTPVENSLSELFSIFDVLLPGYLSSSQQDFDRTFGNPLKLAARKNDDAHDDVVEKKKELLNRMKDGMGQGMEGGAIPPATVEERPQNRGGSAGQSGAAPRVRNVRPAEEGPTVAVLAVAQQWQRGGG
eukprot:Skav226658  [mRNA]  locus=scaffold2733:209570:219498:+ [translate_table: standard]